MLSVLFDWEVTDSKMFLITPMCKNAPTHATALLFQTATTGLWNGTSIISFYFLLYVSQDDFDKPLDDRSLKRRAVGGGLAEGKRGGGSHWQTTQ